MSEPTRIFFSYAHEDEKFVEAIRRHLVLFERCGEILRWTDRQITLGQDWKQEVDSALLDSQIVLLFVSADFFNSDYIWDVEMKEALRKHDAGEAVIIPIIARPCEWMHAPFGNLQALPKDARSLTQWPDFDEACKDVVAGVMNVVRAFRKDRDPHTPHPKMCNPRESSGHTAVPAASKPSVEEKYAELGGPFFGWPLHEVKNAPDEIGRYCTYLRPDGHASIHWTPEHGAHETHGGIRAAWEQLGFEHSFLGYPVTDENDFKVEHCCRFELTTRDISKLPLERDFGRFNEFQGGAIVWWRGTGSPLDDSITVLARTRDLGGWVVKPAGSSGIAADPLSWLNSRTLADQEEIRSIAQATGIHLLNAVIGSMLPRI